MTTDPRIEAVSEAIYVQNVNADDSGPFEFFADRKKEYYRAKAKAVIAAADAVDPLRQPGHRVDINGHDWTLQHPAECRPDLLACLLNAPVRQYDVTSMADGTYTVARTDAGDLLLVPEVTQ